MKTNLQLDPMEQLAKNFNLKPVRNQCGQLIVCSKDVDKAFFDCYEISSNTWCLQGGRIFKEANFFTQRQFTRNEYAHLGYYEHMTIPGLALLLKDQTAFTARRFMKKFIIAVYQQNLMLNNEEYIVLRASGIYLNRQSYPHQLPGNKN